VKQWISLAARLAAGGFFVVAGLLKVASPVESGSAVAAYQISFINGSTAENIGYLLAPLELVLGLALIVGLMTRGAALLTTVLYLAYVAAVVSVWVRGITIDCGCFGGGGYDPHAESKYPLEVARDVALALCAAYVAGNGPGRVALDSLLFRRTSAPAADPVPVPDRPEGDD
jgi:uncharacterized membrane protein YphA (DoxX/SURF4 family)